jgi:hypothetical protein
MNVDEFMIGYCAPMIPTRLPDTPGSRQLRPPLRGVLRGRSQGRDPVRQCGMRAPLQKYGKCAPDAPLTSSFFPLAPDRRAGYRT